MNSRQSRTSLVVSQTQTKSPHRPQLRYLLASVAAVFSLSDFLRSTNARAVKRVLPFHRRPHAYAWICPVCACREYIALWRAVIGSPRPLPLPLLPPRPRTHTHSRLHTLSRNCPHPVLHQPFLFSLAHCISKEPVSQRLCKAFGSCSP
jgi:hypothetical protein